MATADSSNSYLILATAESYFETRLHKDAWDAATSEEKETVLINATRLLDSYLVWNEIPDKDNPDQAIIDATCEMALVILSGDTQVRDDMEGLESVGLKGMNVRARGKKRIIPPHVFLLVSDLATVQGSQTTVIRS